MANKLLTCWWGSRPNKRSNLNSRKMPEDSACSISTTPHSRFSPSLFSWACSLFLRPSLSSKNSYRRTSIHLDRRASHFGGCDFLQHPGRISGNGERNMVGDIVSLIVDDANNITQGDIMYIKESGQGILVLNSHTAAADLLDRRGANYSDRQRFIGARWSINSSGRS